MNRSFKNTTTILISLVCVYFISSTTMLVAQHRGDNLFFQGLTYKDNVSAKSAAMGGAMTAVAGDISSVFYNSAGLTRIDKFQISVNVNNYDRQWRESQNYKPNRQFTTLPFYLEGLYIPIPQNSGKWDYDLYKDTINLYSLNPPLLGKDPYDESAANWEKIKSGTGLTNISIAFPFNISDSKFVLAAGYIKNSINDFDRNDTYLSPFLFSYDYENTIKIVKGGPDTLNVEWSRFTRQRNGSMNNIVAGLSGEVIKNVMIGFGTKIQTGQSDDLQSLTRIGDFHLIDAQRFKFYSPDTTFLRTDTVGVKKSFENASRIVRGTSDYSSTSFNIGILVELNAVKLGLRIDLPYTMTRKWNYTDEQKGWYFVKVSDSLQKHIAAVTVNDSIIRKVDISNTQPLSGKSEIEMPAIYNFGVSFQPVEQFLISFNYEYAPYSKAKFSTTPGDTTVRKWSDQNTLSFGLEYKMFDFLSLMAGYRTIPEVFIPDGAAVKDKGPETSSYNFGISTTTFLGRIDFAYEYRRLKYYDSYYSNTNYAFESNSTIMLGYTYSL